MKSWELIHSGGQIYRSHSNAVTALVVLAISIALAIGGVVRASNSPSIVALGTAYAVFSIFLCGRLLWAGIFTSPDGVHVANIFRNVDLRWGEIDRFEIGRWKVIQGAWWFSC